MYRRMIAPLLVALVGLGLAACASDKGPAEQAVKAVEDALAAVKGEAAKFVPDQLKAVETELAALKASFEKGDYKAILAAGPALTTKAKGLADAAAAKKTEMEAKAAELTKTWTDMSAGLPKMVDALRSRMDILSKAKQLPAKVSKATFDEAKAGLATIDQTWTDAQAAFKDGKLEDAVAKANMVKERTADTMTKLGMTVPPAAK
ncbi:MAG TPA: hypothetical protein VLD61_11470, partial [Methylomirabilota bacterium]|nr:hypothetical protein [Methylomirabilota bacterium]